MIQNPVKQARLRSTLITIILATLPCYLLGSIVLWVGNTIKTRQTLTPQASTTEFVWGGTETLVSPTVQTPTMTDTLTPLPNITPSATSTYFIPSNTPSHTPTITSTPTETPTIIDTATDTVEPTLEISITPSP